MNGKKYYDLLKTHMIEYWVVSSRDEIDKQEIRNVMGKIIPLLKQVKQYKKQSFKQNDPYIGAICDAYRKHSSVSVRTSNVTKIDMLISNIEQSVSYINHHDI